MVDTVSANSDKAQILPPTLTCVKGEPMHKQVMIIICKLTATLMAVSCPWGQKKGHLGLVQNPTIYFYGLHEE